jgi:hypothetical protein
MTALPKWLGGIDADLELAQLPEVIARLAVFARTIASAMVLVAVQGEALVLAYEFSRYLGELALELEELHPHPWPDLLSRTALEGYQDFLGVLEALEGNKNDLVPNLDRALRDFLEAIGALSEMNSLSNRNLVQRCTRIRHDFALFLAQWRSIYGCD